MTKNGIKINNVIKRDYMWLFCVLYREQREREPQFKGTDDTRLVGNGLEEKKKCAGIGRIGILYWC